MVTRRFTLMLVLGITVAWLASGITMMYVLPTWSARASAGDMFGAVNALFSGLALAGIVVAVLLQRQELQLQRKDLSLTRDELRRAARSQEETKRLAELRFMMDLAPQFERHRRSCAEASQTLRGIGKEVLDSDDPRWEQAVTALSAYYQASQFTYQLAVLTRVGALDASTLYLLYFEHMTEDPDGRLQALANWCGTGAELAANCDHDDVVRLAREIAPFLERLFSLHKAAGGEAYDWQVRRTRSIAQELATDALS